MSANVLKLQPAAAIEFHAPTMRRRPVRIIGDDVEALVAARRVAATIAKEAASRDRERRLPYEEMDLLSDAGLLAITVPKAYGGAEVSAGALAEVIAILSEADGSIGQIPQNHFFMLEALRLQGSEEQKRFFYARILAGERIGNALSELGTKTAQDHKTRITRDGPAFRLNGRKFYSTGVLFAHWVAVVANDDDNHSTIAFVRHRSRPWKDSGVEHAYDDPYSIAQVGEMKLRVSASDALLERAGHSVDLAIADPTIETVAAASVAVAEAKAASTEASLHVASKLIELAGSRATLAEYGLDRFWRNARTHSVHDPVRWKYRAIGDYWLNGVNPPRHGAI
jgi:alkylation response protein AidB-like acyl-CoA dehydrogenase